MSEIDKYRARHEQKTSRDQEKMATKGFGKKTILHPDMMVRFTCWVAAFTGCLFVTALVQACAFIQSERAFLFPSAARIDGGLVAEKPLHFVFEIKNSGRSTAFVNEFNVTMGFEKLEATPDYNRVSSTALPPVLAGGVISSFSNPTLPSGEGFSLPQQLVDLVKSGKRNFYIFGFIKYEDEFSLIDRRVGYCFIYNPNGTDSMFNVCTERQYTYSR